MPRERLPLPPDFVEFVVLGFHAGGVEFHDFPVVGHQPVHLALYVRGLRIDRGGQGVLNHRREFFNEKVIVGLKFLPRLVFWVAPVPLVPPEVALDRESQSAEFPVIVLEITVKYPKLLRPPPPRAEFPEIVVEFTNTSPLPYIPPPLTPAELPDIVLPVIMTLA